MHNVKLDCCYQQLSSKFTCAGPRSLVVILRTTTESTPNFLRKLLLTLPEIISPIPFKHLKEQIVPFQFEEEFLQNQLLSYVITVVFASVDIRNIWLENYSIWKLQQLSNDNL